MLGRSVISNSLQPHGLWPARLLCPWNSPGQKTGVGSCFLLQGIFLTKESNSGPLPCRQILYQWSHQGSPKILEWVAYPFSRGSSQPRSQTKVSCIAGDFFASLIAQLVKNPPAMQETPVPFLGREDLLENRYATDSSILGLHLWLSW